MQSLQTEPVPHLSVLKHGLLPFSTFAHALFPIFFSSSQVLMGMVQALKALNRWRKVTVLCDKRGRI